MNGLILAASALVPALLILWYLYSRDKNPEPLGMIVKTFLLGAFICLPVVPLALWLESFGKGCTGMWGHALGGAFLGAAIPEELFKFLVVRGWAWSKPAFDEPMDGIVYGATASLGFAALENLLYVGNGGLGLAALRAITAVPGHALTGVIMGAYAGRAKFTEGAGGALWTGLFVAIVLHGAYDAFLMTESAWALMAIVVLGIEARWARQLIRRMREEQVVPLSTVLVQPAAVGAPVLARPLAPLAPAGLQPPPPMTPAQHRTGWSVLKLIAGGLGASAGSLLILLFLAALAAPEGPAGGEVAIVSTVVAIPTLLFLLLFRSGLRGPFAAQ